MNTITPLRTGTIYCDKGKTLTQGIDEGKMIYIPSISWLITTPTEKILVDTGMPDTIQSTNNHYPGSYQLPGQRIDHALKMINIDVAEISKIIFTHLHWDHCQNALLFPNAQLYIQQKELEFAKNPTGSYLRSYDHPEIMLTPGFQPYTFKVIDEDIEIAPGITAILAAGHSPGHQIVHVQTDSGPYVIAGDAILCYENLMPTNNSDYTLPGRHKDTTQTIQSIEKILSLATTPSRILPGHEEKVFRKARYD